MKKIYGMIAALAMMVLFTAPAAHANTGTMSFPEFSRIYLSESIGYVQVNNTGGDGHNCDCTGHVTDEWTVDGREWIRMRYSVTTLSPDHAAVDYRWFDGDNTYHARNKYWGSTEYTMPAAP